MAIKTSIWLCTSCNTHSHIPDSANPYMGSCPKCHTVGEFEKPEESPLDDPMEEALRLMKKVADERDEALKELQLIRQAYYAYARGSVCVNVNNNVDNSKNFNHL